MPEHFRLMAPGVAPAPDSTQVFAPFDGSLIATVEQADAAGIEQALGTAHGLFRDRDAWLSVERRVTILERTAAIMKERREELAVEAAREGGKPLILGRSPSTAPSFI